MSNPPSASTKVEPPREVGLEPHMRKPAIEFLRDRLRRSKCYLEYGSGGSTRMALRLAVPIIFSVESDLAFADAVRKAAAEDMGNNEAHTRFELLAIDIGSRRKRWGYPDGRDRVEHWHEYPFRVWDELAKAALSPDLILVDGRFRVACILTSLLRASPGTTLVVDDYSVRTEIYGAVERYMKLEKVVGQAAVFTVPTIIDPIPIAFDLAKYCTDPR